MRTWYNNLKSRSILSFQDLCANLVACFSTSISMKKSSTELFGVTQGEKKSTQVYLKRFNEEMLQMENLLEPIAHEALIKRVKSEELWKQFNPLHDITRLRVK